MRKVMSFNVTVFFFFLMVSCAVAVLDDNSTNQDQEQKQSNVVVQGQSVDGSKQSTTVNEGNTDIHSAVWPETPSTSGKEEKSIYSLFGGIGSNKTEEYLRIERAMQTLEKLHETKVNKKPIVSDEEYARGMRLLWYQLQDATRAPKLFGIWSKPGRGTHLFNLFGLLAF